METENVAGSDTTASDTQLVPVVDVEVVEDEEPDVGTGVPDGQLQFEFAEKISDAVWTVRVDGRKRAIDQVVKGLVSLGFNHNEIANILIRLQKETGEMDLALMELTMRQGAKGQK